MTAASARMACACSCGTWEKSIDHWPLVIRSVEGTTKTVIVKGTNSLATLCEVVAREFGVEVGSFKLIYLGKIYTSTESRTILDVGLAHGSTLHYLPSKRTTDASSHK